MHHAKLSTSFIGKMATLSDSDFEYESGNDLDADYSDGDSGDLNVPEHKIGNSLVQNIDRICTANLKVLENHDIVWTSCNLEHNHDADEGNKIERQIISNNLNRKAIENMCKHPSKLLNSYLRENNTNAITTKDVTYIKHNIFQTQASYDQICFVVDKRCKIF
ncbi:vitellogenin receptor [Aphis craccivora]|uniref:Vitellogenin receptor n=1 Tax=Aphis craccivora TaxID=307492 RepID=A0A6G0YJR8_APHCR|nr:vitellogenin receptor [Aphis craccivora]